jgi:hypothetical protein
MELNKTFIIEPLREKNDVIVVFLENKNRKFEVISPSYNLIKIIIR